MIQTIQNFESVPEIIKALLKGEGEKPMSIRQFSRKLGYSTDRTVGMVLQGHREMGPDMLERLADFAQLTGPDKEYLILLTEKQKRKRLGLGAAVLEIENRLQQLKSITL